MVAARILVVDDEPDIRALVGDILGDEGYQVALAENVERARVQKRELQPDLVLLDIWMPKEDGISLLREWVEAGALDCTVIMMSGHGTIETAVEATRLGAWDFIEKPISLAKLLLTVQRALEAGRLRRENFGLRQQLAQPSEPIGQSVVMRELRAQVEHVAAVDSCVLLHGERGVGKQELASWLHARSARADHPFAAFSAEGANWEQARAALLGVENEAGLIECSEGGSLFIDEICALGPELQQVIAQMLERGSVPRPGAATPRGVDLRIIAASAHDLNAAVKSGQLREDIYYQLKVAPIEVPPLREHSEDVPALLQHYAEHFAARDRLRYRNVGVAVQNRLRQHDWPGNVRELRALVQRLLLMRGDTDISLAEVEQALEFGARRGDTEIALNVDLSAGLREARESFERDYLSRQLDAAGGSVAKLAKRVGLERTHLYRKLRDLGIELKSGNRDDP